VAVVVKICGLRSPQDALVAAEAGADMIGLVFAPSRRQVDRSMAKRIVSELRTSEVGRDVTVVGVFVNEPATILREVVDEVGLDWVQLSGHEPRSAVIGFELPILKAVRFDGDQSEVEWLAEPADCTATPLMLDSHVAGSYGGAGVTADWQAAARLAATRSILLAGGLDPHNVVGAIAAVRPWGVDVSSGVETDGVKDYDKIRAFIQAAKAAGIQYKQL
jgi:phosphoribosylanthranilate isomerase